MQTNDNFQVAAALLNQQAAFSRQQIQHSKHVKTRLFIFKLYSFESEHPKSGMPLKKDNLNGILSRN